MSGRGIISTGAHLPHWRLDLTEISPVAGKGGGQGTRTVAGFDEDTTTMGVEAARLALAASGDRADPRSLWFSTARPAYADRTNATAIHAALRLDPSVPAFDANGAARSTVGALRAALAGAGDPSGQALVVASDMVTGLPGSPDEAAGGDAAAALLVGPPSPDGLLAEVVGTASVTEEFLDRWRAPGEAAGAVWEERFGETRYLDVGVRAWEAALDDAGLDAGEVDAVVVAGPHARAGTALVRKLGLEEQVRAAGTAPDLAGTVGYTGAAHPLLALVAALEALPPDRILALASLADGADVVLLRTADGLAASCPAWPLGGQLAAGGRVPYGTSLAWRGFLPVDPPRRPTPSRPSASAAGRSTDWKFGLAGSRAADGTVHLPPAPADPDTWPMAGATGRVATFTVDRLAYSPSPPVVFAVVDFEGGGRLPVELTDVDAGDVRIGDRVEMTFRRLFTAEGIHNYFWKARPVRRTGGRDRGDGPRDAAAGTAGGDPGGTASAGRGTGAGTGDEGS